MTKQTIPTIDLTDLTLAQLDEAADLREQGHGRLAAFAFVGRQQLGRPELTLDDAKGLTMRQVRIVETDPEDDDTDNPEGPTPAP